MVVAASSVIDAGAVSDLRIAEATMLVTNKQQHWKPCPCKDNKALQQMLEQ